MKLYHGTCGAFLPRITQLGLQPNPDGGKYVYLTSDKKRAEHYSFIWTGALMFQLEEREMPMVPPKGVVVEVEVPDELVMVDEYNLEAEPDQYKVLGKIKPKMMRDFHEVKHPKLNKYEERLRAQCLMIGVARATTDEVEEDEDE